MTEQWNAMIAYLIEIRGVVTGVCFRYYACNEARKYPSLQGYVKNVFEGRVEVLVQGKGEEVRPFIEWLKKGPPHARIDDIKINEIPVNPDLPSFRIDY